MRIIKKALFIILRKIIFFYDGVNNELFTKKYVKLLKKVGVNFTGIPNYISSSVYFDGTGYNLITIGKDSVISKNVVLLTHDFSIRTKFVANGSSLAECKNFHIEEKITIGNNVFIGVNSIILPGTFIHDNVIIGAGAVVKGDIISNSIYVGNPAIKINNLDIYDEAKKQIITKKIF